MLSIVIPVYNEEKSLPILTTRLTKILSAISEKYEILFVDDGSTDSSLEIILHLKKSHPNLKIISFDYNMGQTIAMQRGFREAKGDVIITMDADLQNFPEDIPRMLNKLGMGYDVVCGWRIKRKDDFVSKTLPSMLSNLLLRFVSAFRLHDAGCSLRVYKTKSVRHVHLFGEMHRFIPVILAKKGFKVTEIKVRHAKRAHGRTKYGFDRYFRGFMDLLFVIFLSKYARRPLHFFCLLGLITIVGGVLFLVADVLFLMFFFNLSLLEVDIGPAILVSFLMIFFGINFIVLGFMSEMIFSSYNNEIKHKIY